MKLQRSLYQLIAALIFFSFTCQCIAQNNTEVVLLIDISGSMKKNDPQNLRIPATNLLINLLKNRASLTFFTFSTTTQLFLPKSDVTDGYEKKFNNKKAQINSSGKFTNILDA